MSSPIRILPVAALFSCLFVSNCSYDFDAPFAGGNSVGGAGAHDSGIGGSGGSTDGGYEAGGQGGVGAAGQGGAGGVGGSGGVGGAGAGGSSGSGGMAGEAGASGAAGATGGAAGAAGGGAGGAAGAGGAGGTTIAGHECSVVDPNGTGNEPGGLIPVCCELTFLEAAAATELLLLVNQHRVDNGEVALAYDEGLATSIQAHLIHQKLHPFSDFIAPESSIADPPTRAELCGTTMNSAILLSGDATASEVFTQWSQDAQANGILLNPNRTRAAVGHYDDSWAIHIGN